MGDFVQSRLVDKAGPFHNPLEKVTLEVFASDSVIKNNYAKTILLSYLQHLWTTQYGDMIR